MSYPFLEDPDSLGKGLEERCDWCGDPKDECGCGESDPDSAYDRSREE